MALVCCVCMEEESFGAMVQCATCVDGVVCINCVEEMNPHTNKQLNCPCCRSQINHYNLNTIVSLFVEDLARKPITNNLYERLYQHYKTTDTYELMSCSY